MQQNPRHLLSSADITAGETRFLLDLAITLKKRPQPVLAGRQLALLFEKPSLRTRVSFQVAMRHLGGETIYLAPQEVGLGEREAIKDVSRVLSRYVDIVAVRTFGQEIVQEYAEYSGIPVINALTNEEHPCQALADLLTLKEKVGDLKGFSIAYIGDGNNVATSLALTATALGMDVRIAAPKGYSLPEEVVSESTARAQASGGRLTLVNDPAQAAAGAQSVYTDVWTSMGQEREAERRRIAFTGYQLNMELMSKAAPGAFVMHDLPAHRGDEITDEAMESQESIIFDQAENRVWAQAAVATFLLGAAGEVG
ncbi:MAG: ornithine carbamoyltransferase [Dehalococcoidia bacterium]|jgi:ornithine carbamoyltransferase|uniref:ornithine carbamoyltransferase n=1 Tax=Candidatus Amarobacter glycogenicus TaxID=3140699 RepID=UPI001D267D92|nr:ornithine carbamoyltransferase [Dehalococcoidia bacterium]MBK7125716.1 ornithine carbamoyltransferase [Dehalococcoidia bacterium]MBK7724277.1 ornithine carbamoyltransferase [Dehalococcoidia bacterium]MBK9342351.1 ornithine carbamoyltransferase [Dehalococcoidia bacterium]MBK9545786.1 ornithine carbamoyltransferase [Dehalococcoidia bacterium]